MGLLIDVPTMDGNVLGVDSTRAACLFIEGTPDGYASAMSASSHVKSIGEAALPDEMSNGRRRLPFLRDAKRSVYRFDNVYKWKSQKKGHTAEGTIH
jgi:hypothetical protein